MVLVYGTVRSHPSVVACACACGGIIIVPHGSVHRTNSVVDLALFKALLQLPLNRVDGAVRSLPSLLALACAFLGTIIVPYGSVRTRVWCRKVGDVALFESLRRLPLNRVDGAVRSLPSLLALACAFLGTIIVPYGSVHRTNSVVGLALFKALRRLPLNRVDGAVRSLPSLLALACAFLGTIIVPYGSVHRTNSVVGLALFKALRRLPLNRVDGAVRSLPSLLALACAFLGTIIVPYGSVRTRGWCLIKYYFALLDLPVQFVLGGIARFVNWIFRVNCRFYIRFR